LSKKAQALQKASPEVSPAIPESKRAKVRI
jgi:hypothetical protein